MSNEISRIVIIGAGQAGAWAAHTLRESGFSGSISVVSNEDSVFYERPPLSKQVLLGEMSPAQTQLFSDDQIAGMGLQWYKPDTATAIDKLAKQVHLASGKVLDYDKLVLTTGSRARVPNPDWAKIQGVHTVRTLSDVKSLQQDLSNSKKVAIVGGGWIGLEVAASAKKLGLDVAVFELGQRLCARSVSPAVSDFLFSLHQSNGVDVQLDCGPVDLQQGANSSVNVALTDRQEVFDLVVIGAGAEIATELAVKAGLETTMGVVVDVNGKTSDEDIYAAGDVAIHPNLGYCIQSWANAQNQAIAAAKSLLGKPANYADEPWLWSDQYNCNIQILGVCGDQSITNIERYEDEHKRSFIQLDEHGHLVSLISVNDPRIVKLGKRWMQAGSKLPADVLADPAQNLMRLKP